MAMTIKMNAGYRKNETKKKASKCQKLPPTPKKESSSVVTHLMLSTNNNVLSKRQAQSSHIMLSTNNNVLSLNTPARACSSSRHLFLVSLASVEAN
jgi:hypothetical protein